ncbi:MAG: S16 family serine protease, partial [Novosphingobium sp.]
YRLSDPAADLAVAAALISALSDKPLPGDAVWCGEVSLAGEVRPVAHCGLRLREAAKLGFGRAFGPADASGGGKDYREVGLLRNLVDRIMGES